MTFTNTGNTFTGDIVVDGGGFNVDNARDWGAPTVANSTSKTVTLINGGRLNVTSGTLNPGGSTTTPYNLVQIGSGGGTIDTASGATLQLDDAGQLFGSGTLTKTGAGSLSLRNQGTFSGQILVSGGTLQPVGGSGNNLGTFGAGTTIQSGAALNMNGFSITEAEPLTISGTGLASSPAGVVTNNSATGATFSGPVTLAGDSTIGSAAAGGITLSGGVTGAYNLTIKNLSTGTTTISTTSVNNAGTITNSGTGTGGATISAVTGANVTGIVQDSATSSLSLTGNNSTFSGPIHIKAGTLVANLTGVATTLGDGSATNTITLGDSSGSNNTTLNAVNSVTYLQNLIIASGNTGIARINAGTTTGSTILAGTITLNTHDVVLGKVGTTGASQFTGGITGTGNVTILNEATTGTITLASGLVNPVGSIIHSSTATGTTTISAAIGSNVLGVTQNSASSVLTLSNASIAFNGPLTLSAGTLNLIGGSSTGPTVTALTVAAGGTLNLNNTVGQHFNLGSGALSLGVGTGTSTLSLELGSLANYDRFSTSAAATTGNSVVFNLLGLSGFQAGDYDLITSGGGLSGATYSISGITGALAGFSLSFTTSDTLLRLTSTVNNGPYYWKGGINSSWSALSGLNTNFTNDLAGTTNANGVPGLANSVVFSTSTHTAGGTLATSLDGAFNIKDLTFNNQVGAPAYTAISITAGTGGTLTLTPASPSSGISVQTGAPASVAISAPLVLGGNQTWSVADAGTNLAVSGGITGTANLTLAGSGVVTLSGTNTYAGTTTVNGILQAGATNGFNQTSAHIVNSGGILRLNNFSAVIGSLAGSGIVENAGTANNRTLTVGGDNTSTLFSGVLQDGGAFNLGLTKTGTGALTLSGANVNTGNISVSAGTLNLTGSWNGNNTASTLALGGTASNTVTNVSGNISAFGFTGGAVSGAVAVYNQTAGAVAFAGNTSTAVYVANNQGSYGYLNLTGGSFRSGSRFGIAQSQNVAIQATGIVYVGGTGILDLTNSEWALNYSHGHVTVAGNGVIDRSGATQPYGIIMNSTIAGGVYGVLNVAGGSFLTTTQPIRFGNNTTAGNGNNNTALINLAGGILQVGAALSVSLPSAGANNGYINFAGGTLKTSAGITDWIPTAPSGITFTTNLFGAIDNSSLTGAPSFGGGLTFDSNNFNSSWSTVLAGATGDGVAQSSLIVVGGSGYVGAPEVVFSGGTLAAGGTPAAGYALISGGQVTGIVITSPGSYTVAPTVTLTGGGGTGAGVTVGTLVPNTSGGLTKVGAGTLTLSGTNTYTGGTNVNNGTLALGANDVLANGGAVTINGGILDINTRTETVASVTLQSGSITGSTGVLTSSSAYELRSGSISAILAGNVGLNKTTGGTVNLSGVNTYSGTVNATGGTLAFSTGANLGNAAATNTLSLSGGAILSYSGAGSTDLTSTRVLTIGSGGATLEAAQSTGLLQVSGGISGASTGNLTKTGPGAVVISGTTSLNSGAGIVTVSDGKLTAGFGAAGISALTVGTTGNMSFQNGAAEALALSGALNLSTGARLGFDLGTAGVPGISDQINSAIAAVVNGTITLDFTGLSGFGAGSYNLISALSGLSSASYTLGSAPSGFNYSINVTDTLVSLDLVAFQPRYWTNSQGTGSWSTLTGDPFSNFSPDISGTPNSGDIPGTAHTVIFSATSATGPVINTTLDGSFIIDSIQFTSNPSGVSAVNVGPGTPPSSTLTLAPSSTVGGIEAQAGAGTITISAPLVVGAAGGAPSQTWSVSNTGASLIISGGTTFTDRVNKTGAGTLTLSGSNSGNGGITLTGGTLNINSATALGTGTLIIGAGTTIDNSTGGGLVLSTNNGQTWNGSFTFTGTQSLNLGAGDVALNGSTTVTTAANSLTVGGSISDGAGVFSLTKDGTGSLIVNGAANEISGTLTINAGLYSMNNGTSSLGAINGISGTATLNSNLAVTGALTVSGATVTANGTNSIGAGVSVTSGILTLGGANTITGAVVNNGGSVILGGANTITGGVTSSAGTLNINHASGLGSQIFTINGGTINNTSGAPVVNAGNNAQLWNNSFTFTGGNDLDLGTGGVTLGGVVSVTVAAGTLTVGGVIDDGASTFSLTKLGTGTLALNGASTYGGSTTITSGTIIIGVDDALPTTTALTVGNGATAGAFNLGTRSQTVSSLTAANTASTSSIVINTGETLTVNGNVNVSSNVNNATTGMTMSGGGSLVVNGASFTVGNNTLGTNNASQASLNLAALGSFNATVTGTFAVQLTGDNNAKTSSLILSNTANTITAATFGVGVSSSSGQQSVTLGAGTNVINANTINIGTGGRDWASVTFGGTTGTLIVRNTAGTGRAAFNMGTGTASTGAVGANVFDVAGHDADLLLSTLTVGGQNRNGARTDTFSFNQGTLDATTVVVGDNNGTAGTAANTTWTSTLNLGGGTTIIGTGGLEIARGDTAVTGTDTLVGNVNISGGTVTIANNATFGAAVRLAENSIATGLTTNGTLGITGGTVTVAGHIIKGVSTGAGSAVLTLNGGVLNMSGNNIGGTAPATVTFNAQSGTLRNLNELNAGGILNKTTSGTLLLNTSNAYAGLTTVSAGTLAISHGGALGGTTNGTSVAAGGSLDVSGGITVTGEALSLTAGASDAILNSSSGSNTWTGNLTVDTGASTGRARVLSSAGSSLLVSGNVNISGSQDFVIGGDGNGEISGQITGSQRLFKSSVGAGTWILSSDNSTFTGRTTIGNGAIQVASEASLGATPGTFVANQLTLGGGSNGTLKTTGTMSLSANRGVTVAAAGGTFDTAASTTLTVDSVITGAGNLAKNGAGTLKLTAANTLSGSVTILGGVLEVTNTSGSATGSGDVTLSGGGTTLAGSGSISGGTILGGGTILAPGEGNTASSNKTLTFTSVTAANTAQIQLGVTSADSVDASFAAWFQANPGGTAAGYLATLSGGIADTTWNNSPTGDHDRIVASGSLALGDALTADGRVAVSLNGLTSVTYGSIFNLLDWSTASTKDQNSLSSMSGGTFSLANLQLEAFAGALSGFAWDTSVFDSYGILVVVPEPSRGLLIMFGLWALLVRRRRA